jgi:hypothetical protein
MRTAMQEHLEWLKSKLEICEDYAPRLVNCIELCISDAESRLEMEKEQIMGAWHGDYKTAEQYYNETFKSE